MSDIPFLNALYRASQRPHAAFYAPGHKQGQGISETMIQLMGAKGLRADLPELPELDNLFAPEGAILEAQILAAQAFGADQTCFLANGSTCGIEAALLATCGPGDRVLLPRNVHQSIISALILSGAIPIFIAPDYDPEWDMAHGVDPEAIATALNTHPDIKAIVIVSPTYYGTCSDVEAIATLAHAHHIPLIVDEAHGPHFGFHPQLPKSALAAGADVVIQSTHKVLSAMSQASMLHLQHSPRVSPQRIRQALQLVQSTSPNYLLLASLDAARHQIATQGYELMQRTLDLAKRARTELSKIPGLRVFDATNHHHRPGIIDGDRTRLTVDVRGLGLTGFDADDILHTQLGVTCELPTLKHLTFIISLGNTSDDIDRLIQSFQTLTTQQHKKMGDARAFLEYPSGLYPSYELTDAFLEYLSVEASYNDFPKSKIVRLSAHDEVQNPKSLVSAPITLSPRDAFFAPSKQVAITQAIGNISTELICPYPPGIPLIMPGETITLQAVKTLQTILDSGGFISGCTDSTLKTLVIVDTQSSE